MEISTSLPPTEILSQDKKIANTGKDVIGSDFETFLVMLTAQMENQDPLNPVDSQDFATQLATFSGVEQQVKTNDLLGDLHSQLTLSSLGEMAGWVGMEARISAPASFSGNPVELVSNPPQYADSAELIVYDADEVEVQRISVPVSDENIYWSGLDTKGNPFQLGIYSFAIEATSNGEVIDRKTPDIFESIREVRIQNGNPVVVTASGSVHPSTIVNGLR